MRVILLLLLVRLTTGFYIGFSIPSTPPRISDISRAKYYQCHRIRLPSTSTPLLAISLYNPASQTYYPGGIQLYNDPGSQCAGEPSLIITSSQRPGAYWIDFRELGIVGVYTCWRIYDLQQNPFHLLSNDINRERKLGDLVFKRDPRTEKWEQVAEVRDVPNRVMQNGEFIGITPYTREYEEKWGTPPEFIRKGEPGRVIPWMEANLKRVEEEGYGDVKVEENLPLQIERVETTAELKEKYREGSLRYLQELARQPWIKSGEKKTEDRMREILREDAEGRIKIPMPEKMFGIPYNREKGVEGVLRDIGENFRVGGDEVKLGWALLRLAEGRERGMLEGVDFADVIKNMQNRQPQEPPMSQDRGEDGRRKEKEERKTALLDISGLEEVDQSREAKVDPKEQLLPIIAKYTGPRRNKAIQSLNNLDDNADSQEYEPTVGKEIKSQSFNEVPRVPSLEEVIRRANSVPWSDSADRLPFGEAETMPAGMFQDVRGQLVWFPGEGRDRDVFDLPDFE